MSGPIIIIDKDTGESWKYTETKSGYATAKTKIDEINQKGHVASGDLERVKIVFPY